MDASSLPYWRAWPTRRQYDRPPAWGTPAACMACMAPPAWGTPAACMAAWRHQHGAPLLHAWRHVHTGLGRGTLLHRVGSRHLTTQGWVMAPYYTGFGHGVLLCFPPWRVSRWDGSQTGRAWWQVHLPLLMAPPLHLPVLMVPPLQQGGSGPPLRGH